MPAPASTNSRSGRARRRGMERASLTRAIDARARVIGSCLLGNPVFEVSPGKETGLRVERRQVAEEDADKRKAEPLDVADDALERPPCRRPRRDDEVLDHDEHQ